jgi:cytochrome c
MLEKAVQHYQEVGRERAHADFTGRKAPFFDRDLYVSCIGADHIITANGGFPSLVGTSVDAWKDADGKSVGKAISDAVSSTGEGSVRYRWFNPVSGKIEPKVLFSRKVADEICGVGAYNPE